jgi:hypothetical protein
LDLKAPISSPTFTGATTISVTDNTNAALRITQTGAGNALVVEDSANPDSTPFVIDASGNVIQGSTSSLSFSAPAGTVTPTIQSIAQGSSLTQGIASVTNVTSANGPNFIFGKSRGLSASSPTIVSDADVTGTISFTGYDGAAYLRGAQILAAVDGTPGTNDMPGRLVFSTTADGASSPTERMRIDNAGRVGIGATPIVYQTLTVSKNLTGFTSTRGIVSSGQIQSDSTAGANYFSATSSTQATTFNTIHLGLYSATQGTFGVGSTVTNQYGFSAGSSLTGATNNYGFYGTIASGTGRYNLYMDGTASNYLAGSLGIGVLPAVGVNLYVGSTLTGGVAAIGTRSSGVIQADVTSSARYVYAQSSALATVTAVNVYTFSAQQGNLSGAAITSQYGYHAESSLIGATNNYGFFGNIASGTGRYNLYMAGTANNYLGGPLITAGLKATSAAAPTIASATTIAPTTQIAFVSGTTAIATITAPSPISLGGGQITLIPTGIFTTTTAGNIALASTAVVGKALIMTYDATTTKWYPSY